MVVVQCSAVVLNVLFGSCTSSSMKPSHPRLVGLVTNKTRIRQAINSANV